jgi:hypothetical protein
LVRDALDALAFTLDGRAAAATTSRRKRSIFYNILQYAVELEFLDFNPVDKLRFGRTARRWSTRRTAAWSSVPARPESYLPL